MVVLHMLTTVDNPFDPFTQYDEWAQWDEAAGYNTPQLLARVVISSYDLSEAEQDLAIEQAISEIVEYNVSGRHKKVAAPTETNKD